MPKKLTLEMKKQISEEVAAETRRCLNIVREEQRKGLGAMSPSAILTRIIEGCPYIEFHPELKELIPRG